jgi:hypothetical protein
MRGALDFWRFVLWFAAKAIFFAAVCAGLIFWLGWIGFAIVMVGLIAAVTWVAWE